MKIGECWWTNVEGTVQLWLTGALTYVCICVLGRVPGILSRSNTIYYSILDYSLSAAVSTVHCPSLSTIDPHHSVHQVLAYWKAPRTLSRTQDCHHCNKLDRQLDPALLCSGQLVCKIKEYLSAWVPTINFEKFACGTYEFNGTQSKLECVEANTIVLASSVISVVVHTLVHLGTVLLGLLSVMQHR
jgi:hypothetical protein